MDPVSETLAVVEFGRFKVLPRRRELLADDRPIQLGGRAFDVLMALIEASGAVVSKDALMERVWPNRLVDENSLQVQISALRNVFAADRDLIRTIPGRSGRPHSACATGVTPEPLGGVPAVTSSRSTTAAVVGSGRRLRRPAQSSIAAVSSMR